MITIKTGSADGFLNTLYKAFEEKSTEEEPEKELPTWDCKSSPKGTKYFTHNPKQWNGKAWFRAYIPPNTTDEVRFVIVKPDNAVIESAIYSHYHGRFIAMLFSNFGNTFISITATSLPTSEDSVN
ncbi:hypothetical protein [Hymenobacter negativus]|uniref:Uncharacterized protein n=1 Tax=Hymenobacter negativus TaxID=2795026 RepID=A0ABS3QI32_9BACT|nr:hypothetical protein [Hymenobacter negativus]MBO2010904.1 hypothetical protein [Hymenobacter negativus]